MSVCLSLSVSWLVCLSYFSVTLPHWDASLFDNNLRWAVAFMEENVEGVHQIVQTCPGTRLPVTNPGLEASGGLWSSACPTSPTSAPPRSSGTKANSCFVDFQLDGLICLFFCFICLV